MKIYERAKKIATKLYTDVAISTFIQKQEIKLLFSRLQFFACKWLLKFRLYVLRKAL